MKRIVVTVLFFMFAVPHAGISEELPPFAPESLLAPLENLKQDAEYLKICRLQSHGLVLEKEKINYLLNRIKYSKYAFIRNGRAVSAEKTSEFLHWKYARKAGKKKIQTAEDFVLNIASGSDMSGEPYRVKTDRYKKYPLRDFMLRELAYLETLLNECPADA